MTALQALLIFLISFMVVAVLFKMPVSFALGTSSLLVLAFGGYLLSGHSHSPECPRHHVRSGLRRQDL